MAEWIITSSILMAVVLALRQMLKRRMSPVVQYALWGLVLVRLLVPVSLGSAGFSAGALAHELWDRPAVQQAWDSIGMNRETVSRDEAYAQVTAKYQEGHSEAYPQYLESMDPGVFHGETARVIENSKVARLAAHGVEMIWLTGMAACAVALVASNRTFGKKLNGHRRQLDVEDYPLKVYVSYGAETPCLLGLLDPAIYVPVSVAPEETALRHVLAHEFSHYRHKDHIWSALRGLCLVLHWYNPLVWAAAIASRKDAELACDAATVKRLGETERTAYGRTLIRMTCEKPTNQFVTATTMTGDRKTLQERIIRIARQPKMRAATLALVVVLAAVTVGFTFPGAGTDPTIEQAVVERLIQGDPYQSFDPYRSFECCGEGHKILQVNDYGDAVDVYLVYSTAVYQFVNGNLEIAGGSSGIPAKWTFAKKADGALTLKYSEVPRDGSLFLSDIRRIFPLHLQFRAIYPAYSTMNLQCHRYARAYLQEIGRDAKVGRYGDFQHELATDQGMSVEVSNELLGMEKLNDYPFFLGNVERVEDGVRWVYEHIWTPDGDSGNGVALYRKYRYDTGEPVEVYSFLVEGDRLQEMIWHGGPARNPNPGA